MSSSSIRMGLSAAMRFSL